MKKSNQILSVIGVTACCLLLAGPMCVRAEDTDTIEDGVYRRTFLHNSKKSSIFAAEIA